MAEFPEGFDLAALTAPFAGDGPAGSDLRTDASPQSLYHRLRDARAEARAGERAMEGDEGSGGVPPQWRSVREMGLAALAEHSKDLEVAAWLTEALLRLDGLAGFTAGIRLMSGLVEGFWDSLFPLPDDEGIATRVAPVAGLNGQSGDGSLAQPLRRLALYLRPDGSPLQFWQYEQSSGLAAIVDPERRQLRIDAGVVPFETLEAEAQAAGVAPFASLRDEAAAALAAWQALAGAVDARAGVDTPPTSRVREILDRLAAVGARFAGAAGIAPAEVAIGEGGVAEPPAVAPAAALNSREEALRGLAAIADFFRRTEPLSPLAYTLQEAVRRARLSWPELLTEIVPDSGVRDQILISLGIRPPPGEQ